MAALATLPRQTGPLPGVPLPGFMDPKPPPGPMAPMPGMLLDTGRPPPGPLPPQPAQPGAPVPTPQAAPYPGAPGAPPYAPPSTTGRTFTGTAPAPTPYGEFTGPNPAAVSADPYYQFRAHEGEQAIQRAAAAHGTLLNGGTLKSLEGYRQGLASEEAGHAFDRALTSYTTNRDTNQQNYNQGQTSFHGNLDTFNSNTNAAGVYGRLDAEKAAAAKSAADDTAAAQERQRQTETNANASAQAQAAQQNADSYAQQVESARRQNDAISAFGRLPASPGFFNRPRPVLR